MGVFESLTITTVLREQRGEGGYVPENLFSWKNVAAAMIRTVATLLLFLLSLARAQPPPNDACANATVVDPNSRIPIYGNNALSVTDGTLEQTCIPRFQELTNDNGNGLWYKFVSSALAEVIATTCNKGTDIPTILSAHVGNDCNSLSCVSVDKRYCFLGPPDNIGGITMKFLTEPNKTYWILVQGYATDTGIFNLSLSVNPGTFILVDSIANRRIDLLTDDVRYSRLPTTRLNIEAAFISIPKSVRVTFDNPPRNFCESKPPFSVFGDSNGDYFNATIPVGDHLVTATPYNQTKCKGTAGPTQNLAFSLGGCILDTSFFDVAYNVTAGNIYYLEYVPCSLNIEAKIQCGFPVTKVKLELRNTVTNTLLVSRNQRAAPFYLFGDVKGKPLSGTLPPGEYTLSVIVDGINIQEDFFVFSKECAKNIPPNDICSNATSIALDSGAPFRAIGDTTFAVVDSARENSCNILEFSTASGLWYKIKTPLAPIVSQIVATTCSSVTNFDTGINVFVGNDCSLLSCVSMATSSCGNTQGTSVMFLSEPNQIYWIVVKGTGSGVESGIFQLTVEYKPNLFVFVDPVSAGQISLLQDASYIKLPVSQLNIQAIYDPALPAPRSVRLTFDNPTRNVCDDTPPFSVFGDLNGNFFNVTIPIGNHTVTATPYNSTNCTGPAGPTRSESFFLAGCYVDYEIVDAIGFTTVELLFGFYEEAILLDPLPCSVNIIADVWCGFRPKEVKMELFDTETDKLLVSRIERDRPYSLFGDTYIENGKVLGEQISPGEYKITATVDDGIELESVEFIVVVDCVP
jgi:hypothetical protein